jgi:hypothetical protein
MLFQTDQFHFAHLYSERPQQRIADLSANMITGILVFAVGGGGMTIDASATHMRCRCRSP